MDVLIITQVRVVCLHLSLDHRLLPLTAGHHQAEQEHPNKDPVAKVVDGTEEPELVEKEVGPGHCALVFRCVSVTVPGGLGGVVPRSRPLRGCLDEVLLAAVHDVLRGQAVEHVAGVQYDEQQDHTQEQQGLGPGLLRTDLIQPYPEEPDAHVPDASHGGEDKVHGDDGDQNVVQRKHRL